jgi:chromosomal replication initiator protein
LTFAHFLPLPENRSALLAVERVAAGLCTRRPRPAVNPLYLHGPPGTGKTHLVNAFCEEISRRAPALAAVVLPARDLVAREADGDQAKLEEARHSDVLIVEDLQYLPARGAEALVGLFDELLASLGQMVFTATTGPAHLDVPGRLRSRLGSGLIVSLEPLQPTSRLAFLTDRAQRRQLAVSQEVLGWLAQRLTGCRHLEGALARLEALSRRHRRTLDLALVCEHFQDEAAAGQLSMERIAQRVSGHFHVEAKHLRSERRSRNVVLPRHVGMYLARQLTDLSLEQIGNYFGGRDHSTVLHACRKVELALKRDPGLCGTIRQLQTDLL